MLLSKHPFTRTFKNIYEKLPNDLQKEFWYTAAISFFVAIFELAVALVVSLLGVALATPDAVVNFGPIKAIYTLFPWAQEIILDQRKLLVALLFIIIILLIFKLVTSLYMYWKQSDYSQNVAKHINYTLFKGFLYGSYLWHTKQETTVLLNNLGWREQVAMFMTQILLFLTYSLITILLLLGIIITSPLIGLFVLSLTGCSAILIFKWARKQAKILNTELANLQIQMASATLPALQGIREVLIYRQQEEFLHINSNIIQNIVRVRPRIDVLPPLPPLFLELVGMIMLCISVLVMNAYSTSLAHMTATLTLMAAAAWRLLPTMNRFITSLINAQSALPFVEPVLARIDEIRNFSGEAIVEALPCQLNSAIVFNNINFRYPETNKDKPDALQNINLTITKGTKVGFIGASGAGKSTLIGLLTGLFPPTDGTIYIDEKPMTDELRAGWMQGIGYVPQSTFLLNSSIAKNVAFSKWGKEVDEDHVKKCCRMAAMHFIDELPDGIHTIIGERGIKLSGGQVQRISVARALYNNPHTLIFDEATSALDGGSEKEIMHTINTLDKNITVIVVAHRLSTVEKCDYIYWMKDGKVHREGQAATIIKEYEDFFDIKSH